LEVFGRLARPRPPRRVKALSALVVVAAGVAPWLAYPRAAGWICWKEAQANSEARR